MSSNDTASSISSSNLTQKYSVPPIENFLKRKDNSKQFIVMKYNQKEVSSRAWSTFGSPAKRVKSGSYQRIIAFASCLNCTNTSSFQSGGTGSTKHLLRHVCSKKYHPY